MIVRDLMTTRLITVDAEATIGDAWFLIKKHRVRHLPVMRGQQLAGIISERDVAGWLTPRIATEDEQEGEAEALDYLIEDVMSTELRTVRDTDGIAVAAEVLAEGRIGGVPVLDDAGKCVGIITVVDLLRDFARRLRADTLPG